MVEEVAFENFLPNFEVVKFQAVNDDGVPEYHTGIWQFLLGLTQCGIAYWGFYIYKTYNLDQPASVDKTKNPYK